jgi:DNA-binding CsgD family transcriptional regulator
MTVEQRRERVAGMYPELSSPAIARELGVSHWTVLQDLRALCIPAQPPGPRKRHAPAAPRACALCGGVFTPRDDHPRQLFCSRSCADRGRRASPFQRVTRAERLELSWILYLGGSSYQEIAERFGITTMTARKDVLAVGVSSRPAYRRPIHVRGQWIACKCGCGRRRWVYASQGYEFLGNDCWARYRWQKGIALDPLVAELKRQGRFGPAARRRWHGRWKLAEVRVNGGRAKGLTEALEVGRAALELVAKHPAAARDRAVRRLVIEALIRRFIGSVGTDTADPGYRRARSAIRRRVQRARQELGEQGRKLDALL